MGKQVNFYANNDDLREVQAKLEAEDVVFVESRFPKQQIETVGTLLVPVMEESALRLNLMRGQDFPLVQFNKRQDFFEIDTLRSPVIEFDRCYYNDRLMRRGRAFFETGFYDSAGDWTSKPTDFNQWGDQFLRWLRRYFIRDEATKFYMGPLTQEWVAAEKIALV